MTTLAEHTEAHRIAFAEIDDLLAGLTDDQLAVQSLCPEWDVKACIAHAIGIEKALTGWTPDPENLFDFGILDWRGLIRVNLQVKQSSMAIDQYTRPMAFEKGAFWDDRHLHQWYAVRKVEWLHQRRVFQFLD